MTLVIPPHGSYVQLEHWFPVPHDRPVARSYFGLKPQGRKRRMRIRALVEASGQRCGICRRSFDEPATVDHVVPQSRGGGEEGNLVPAHLSCNRAKGNRLPTGCELIWLAGVNARLGIAA